MLPAGNTADTLVGFCVNPPPPCCPHGSAVSCQRLCPGNESSVVEDGEALKPPAVSVCVVTTDRWQRDGLNCSPNCPSHTNTYRFLLRLSGRLDVMPVHVLSEGAGPDAQVPAHLTRIPVSVIGTSGDYVNNTVQV